MYSVVCKILYNVKYTFEYMIKVLFVLIILYYYLFMPEFVGQCLLQHNLHRHKNAIRLVSLHVYMYVRTRPMSCLEKVSRQVW